jgi:hypothetical protein
VKSLTCSSRRCCPTRYRAFSNDGARRLTQVCNGGVFSNMERGDSVAQVSVAWNTSRETGRLTTLARAPAFDW